MFFFGFVVILVVLLLVLTLIGLAFRFQEPILIIFNAILLFPLTIPLNLSYEMRSSTVTPDSVAHVANITVATLGTNVITSDLAATFNANTNNVKILVNEHFNIYGSNFRTVKTLIVETVTNKVDKVESN